MRFRITSLNGKTSVVNAETGELIKVTSVVFEHRHYDEAPLLTITTNDFDVELDLDLDPTLPAKTEFFTKAREISQAGNSLAQFLTHRPKKSD